MEEAAGGEQFQELALFAANMVEFWVSMREPHSPEQFSKQPWNSVLVTVQPHIGAYTYVLHPVLYSYYSYSVYEAYEMEERRCERVQERLEWESHFFLKDHLYMPIDNLKVENQAHERVAFLNLDGYDCEYNLEVARNFREHLMYISFPKFDRTTMRKSATYESRFLKKYFYNFLRGNARKMCSDRLSEAQLRVLLEEELTLNPEKYQEAVDEMYADPSSFMEAEFNSNIYVFPVRMEKLLEQFGALLDSQEPTQYGLTSNQTSTRHGGFVTQHNSQAKQPTAGSVVYVKNVISTG